MHSINKQFNIYVHINFYIFRYNGNILSFIHIDINIVASSPVKETVLERKYLNLSQV